MARFKYTACGDSGESQSGEIEAANELEARNLLEGQGLLIDQLDVIVESEGVALTVEESQQVTSRLAQLASLSLPLATGLRAGAQECGNRRIADALLAIADRVENGQSLEEVIAGTPGLFPPHVSGLVLAAAKTGTLGVALAELVEHQRAARALRTRILRAFAYPMFVVALAVFVLLFVLFAISDSYLRMFTEFGLQLPLSTRLLIWWRDYGVAVVAIVGSSGLILALILRFTLPRAIWSRLVFGVPIVGPLSYWMALAEWCSLLSVLIKNRIALPEALRLSACGIENAYIAQVVRELSVRTSQGQPLAELLAKERPLPVSLVPLIRWGERLGLLDEALATARELFDRRANVRALMLQSILPPILFISIACVILMVVAALFAPMTGLITNLS